MRKYFILITMFFIYNCRAADQDQVYQNLQIRSDDMQDDEFALARTQSNAEPFLSEELIEAAQNGNLDRIKQFIEVENGDINKRTEKYSDTLLMISAEYNQIEILEYLIAHGAELNLFNIAGDTALYIATKNISGKNGNFEIIKILCNAGADIYLSNNNWALSPFNYALQISWRYFIGDEYCEINYKPYIQVSAYFQCIANTGKTPEKMYATDMLDKAYRERTLPFPKEVLSIIKEYL